MPTKAELEKENRMLHDLVKPSISITDSTFMGSPNDKKCKAVSKIADALKEAAKAMNGGDTMVHFGDKDYHDEEK